MARTKKCKWREGEGLPIFPRCAGVSALDIRLFCVCAWGGAWRRTDVNILHVCTLVLFSSFTVAENEFLASDVQLHPNTNARSPWNRSVANRDKLRDVPTRTESRRGGSSVRPLSALFQKRWLASPPVESDGLHLSPGETQSPTLTDLQVPIYHIHL